VQSLAALPERTQGATSGAHNPVPASTSEQMAHAMSPPVLKLGILIIGHLSKLKATGLLSI
jgi:hypothetical protein